MLILNNWALTKLRMFDEYKVNEVFMKIIHFAACHEKSVLFNLMIYVQTIAAIMILETFY